MGSDLYLSIGVRVKEARRDWRGWATLFDGPSSALDRGIVVDAFGDCDPETPVGRASGYLTPEEVNKQAEHPECPWRLDEPYWVREIEGSEFVAIVREKRWQALQDGDFHDQECSPELRAFAACVESLLGEGHEVRVLCWHSQ